MRDYGTATWEGGSKDCNHIMENTERGDGDPKSCQPRGKYLTKDVCKRCGAKRIDQQLGLEKTFEEYIDKLCTIYDEVKRILRKDGTCFVNLGDTYANTGYGKGTGNFQSKGKEGALTPQNKCDLPAKSLCLIPQRFAIEMVNRGWILRNVIIWHKPNPMPSSAKDRFTVDFEYVYFFVKSSKPSYYVNSRKRRSSSTQKYDYIWIHKETGLELDYQPFSDRLCKGKKRLWNRRNLWEGRDYYFEPQYEPYLKPLDRWGGDELKANGQSTWDEGTGQLTYRDRNMRPNPLGRNKRCVWTIPTQPFPEAHFATYPEKLVEPMIKAGCPEFICTKCGKAREKMYKPSDEYAAKLEKSKEKGGIYTYVKDCDGFEYGGKQANASVNPERMFIGYTYCGCNAEFEPGVVLDPFAGSGTTLQVAARLNRNYLGIELKPEYIEMAEKRTIQGETGIPTKEQKQGQQALFPIGKQ